MTLYQEVTFSIDNFFHVFDSVDGKVHARNIQDQTSGKEIEWQVEQKAGNHA